jgi:hypothetical protein
MVFKNDPELKMSGLALKMGKGCGFISGKRIWIVWKDFSIRKASRSEHGEYDKLPRLSLKIRKRNFNATVTLGLKYQT